MNFISEDGSSKSDATSYATVAEFRAFWEDRGQSVNIAEATIQGYLNSATEYIDLAFDFLGYPTDTDQALQWPRYIDGQTGLPRAVIESDEIPIEIKNATCWLADQASNGTLFEVDAGISSESYGGISKTYRRSSGYKRYPYIEKILTKYLIISGTPIQRVN